LIAAFTLAATPDALVGLMRKVPVVLLHVLVVPTAIELPEAGTKPRVLTPGTLQVKAAPVKLVTVTTVPAAVAVTLGSAVVPVPKHGTAVPQRALFAIIAAAMLAVYCTVVDPFVRSMQKALAPQPDAKL
jgi:hypothetical protein